MAEHFDGDVDAGILAAQRRIAEVQTQASAVVAVEVAPVVAAEAVEAAAPAARPVYQIIDVPELPPMKFGIRKADPWGVLAMPIADLVVGKGFVHPMKTGESYTKMAPFIRRRAAALGMKVAMRRTTVGLLVTRIE